MAHILLLYATREGQTAKIADALADRLQQAGHAVDIRSADAAPAHPDPKRWDAFVLGASVHGGKHEAELTEWMETNREALLSRPTWFFSVCLAAASERPSGPDEALAQARAGLEAMNLGEVPFEVFAGALRYSAYGWLTRLMMRRIARKEGGPTDTDADVEYTDWTRVEAFADRISDALDAKR